MFLIATSRCTDRASGFLLISFKSRLMNTDLRKESSVAVVIIFCQTSCWPAVLYELAGEKVLTCILSVADSLLLERHSDLKSLVILPALAAEVEFYLAYM